MGTKDRTVKITGRNQALFAGSYAEGINSRQDICVIDGSRGDSVEVPGNQLVIAACFSFNCGLSVCPAAMGFCLVSCVVRPQLSKIWTSCSSLEDVAKATHMHLAVDMISLCRGRDKYFGATYTLYLKQ